MRGTTVATEPTDHEGRPLTYWGGTPASAQSPDGGAGEFVPIPDLRPGDIVLEDGVINCQVRIEGTYKGVSFVYTDEGEDRSQFIWPEDEDGNVNLSEFWWSEGNYGCDCNRCSFLPGNVKLDCGHEIRIDKIIPLDPRLPELNLFESYKESKSGN